MATDGLIWGSVREREVAIASGLRVVSGGAGGAPAQVQVLELGPGGKVRVASVVPGDERHLRLWRQLMTAESEWGSFYWTEGEE